jgi:adenylate kinase
MINIILQNLKEVDVCERGYILDGFPRTKVQAQALLEAGYLPDHVIEIDIPDSKILEYAAGRGVIKSEYKNSRSTKIAKETLNADIDPNIVIHRLETYRRNKATILDLFKSNYRRFFFLNGLEGEVQNLLQGIQTFLGTKSLSKAPRSFRIVIGGLPGSGKTTIASFIAQKYGAVLVSPKSIMLQAISAGNGEKFLPYINMPNQGKE